MRRPKAASPVSSSASSRSASNDARLRRPSDRSRSARSIGAAWRKRSRETPARSSASISAWTNSTEVPTSQSLYPQPGRSGVALGPRRRGPHSPPARHDSHRLARSRHREPPAAQLDAEGDRGPDVAALPGSDRHWPRRHCSRRWRGEAERAAAGAEDPRDKALGGDAMSRCGEVQRTMAATMPRGPVQ